MTAWDETKQRVDSERLHAAIQDLREPEPPNDSEMTPELHQLEETLGALLASRKALGWPARIEEKRAVGMGKRDLIIFQDPPCIVEVTEWDPVLPGNRVYMEGKDIRTGEPWHRTCGWYESLVVITGESPAQRAALEATVRNSSGGLQL